MYIIGIDGGGTKTEAVVYNLEGKQLFRAETGFGNITAGREEAIKNITMAVMQCIDNMGREGLEGIYMGLAGIEAGDNKAMVESSVEKILNIKPHIVNDGELALRAMLKGEDGMLTISGTGSIAFGINGAVKERCGGWGHILGDEGSAYGIAVDAFKQITYEADCKMDYSVLSLKMLGALRTDSIEKLLGFIYSANKKEIAAYAPIVSRLAEEGDKLAMAILEQQGVRLGETMVRLYKKLNFSQPCYLALKGSTILNSKVLRSRFEEYVRSRINNITIIDNEISSAQGAYYIYAKERKKNI